MSDGLSLRRKGVRLVTEVEGWPPGTVGTLMEPYLFTALFLVEDEERFAVFAVGAECVENVPQ